MATPIPTAAHAAAAASAAVIPPHCPAAATATRGRIGQNHGDLGKADAIFPVLTLRSTYRQSAERGRDEHCITNFAMHASSRVSTFSGWRPKLSLILRSGGGHVTAGRYRSQRLAWCLIILLLASSPSTDRPLPFFQGKPQQTDQSLTCPLDGGELVDDGDSYYCQECGTYFDESPDGGVAGGGPDSS
jgi:hypothetical protein